MKNKFILVLLSMLGFATACSDEEAGTETPDMYGTPYVTFSAKGKVTNEAGESVKGIDVGLERDNHSAGEFTTDENGEFVIEQGSISSIDLNSKEVLVFTDIDGEENGSYETQEVEVSFVKNEDVPTGDWYNGDYVATEDVEVVLQEKTAVEE